MRAAVFRASPREKGNTNRLTDAVVASMKEKDWQVTEFDLYSQEILPCVACRECQKDWTAITCARKDDMERIFPAVADCDLILLATPVYSWYCTPPMKAMLDRLVYAMNMYYGEERGPSLWEGKEVALIVTSGYPRDRGPDLFEEGMRRYCRHSRLVYRGMLWGQHLGYTSEFMDEEKRKAARAFADRLSAGGE